MPNYGGIRDAFKYWIICREWEENSHLNKCKQLQRNVVVDVFQKSMLVTRQNCYGNAQEDINGKQHQAVLRIKNLGAINVHMKTETRPDFWVLMQCIKVVWKERPDVVISTGAAPAFLLCITAKIFGAKIVWIDSIANVERLSMSGQMAKPFSSLFLTQWPELAKKYNDVEYTGAVT